MSVTHRVTRTYQDASSSAISDTESVSADGEVNIDGTVAVVTNQAINFAVVRADLKSLSIYASGACTLYTNAASTGSPTETIAMAAGQTKVWTLAGDGLAKCPFSASVTAMYITNAAGSVNFKIRALVDATP